MSYDDANRKFFATGNDQQNVQPWLTWVLIFLLHFVRYPIPNPNIESCKIKQLIPLFYRFPPREWGKMPTANGFDPTGFGAERENHINWRVYLKNQSKGKEKKLTKSTCYEKANQGQHRETFPRLSSVVLFSRRNVNREHIVRLEMGGN